MTTETIGTLDYNEITFPKLGIDLHLDSTAFSIGGLDIQWYGILITLGLVLAMVYAFTQVKKDGLNPDRVMDCIIGGIIGGVVGARAGKADSPFTAASSAAFWQDFWWQRYAR